MAAAAPLGAQTRPSLDQVDSLIAAGRTEEARTALTTWMGPPRGSGRPATAATPAPTRAETQRALWLRALLTVDPVQAAVDYQRLVVEFPGGPFSDRAVLRLAQGAAAQGDSARARQLLTSMLRDYQSSPMRLDAGALMASLPEAQAPAAATPAIPPAPAAPSAPAAAPQPEGRWTVQLGAFAISERAAGLKQQLADGGVEARLVLVPESRLIRVRAGRYGSQAEADRVRVRLTERGLDATVAGDADREEVAP